MDAVTKGEQWKMALLTQSLSPSDATDELLESRLGSSTKALINTVMPMAQLRAEQIEAGLHSEDETTRVEAARMNKRYNREPAEDAPSQEAHKAAAEMSDEATPLAQKIAGDWVGKILSGGMIGEMEKDLTRTVDSYRTEQQENVLRLSHNVAPEHGVAR